MKVNGAPELNWKGMENLLRDEKVADCELENLVRDEKLAESEPENLVRDEKVAESELENLVRKLAESIPENLEREEKVTESELENLGRDEKLAESEPENLRRDEKLAESELENATPSLRKQLPEEIWGQILLRVSTIDKLRSADKVCAIWRRLLKEPLMWRVIDLRDQKCIPLRIMNTLFHVAVDRSKGQCLDFRYAFCGPKDIAYVAERSKNLRRLWLGGWAGVIGVPVYSSLIKVAPRLCHLEELSLQGCLITPDCIKALGEHCPRLTSFSLIHFDAVTFETEEENNMYALAVAAHLCLLCRLQLVGDSLTVLGLEAILEGCPNLKSLDLRRCSGVDLSGHIGDRCRGMVNFQHPTDSMSDFMFLV